MRRAVTKLISNKSNIFSAGIGQDSTSYRLDFNAVKDFYIVLDKPHQSWKPGDEVSGQIIFISKKNLANIYITLSLIGTVKVNAIHHSKLRPVKHNLFNHTITIYGDDQQRVSQGNDDFENGLYKGEHRFPFIVKLPIKKVFTSIDFGKGSIKYLLKASIGNIDTSNTNSPPNPTTPSPESPGSGAAGSNFMNKTKSFKIRQNATYTSEKIINLVKSIDVAKLPPPKPKRLIIKDPKRNKMLARTQSSTSTINTFNTMGSISSNNSDSHTSPDTVSNSNTPGSHLAQGDASRPENIKVSFEIPDKGYLRGELIPIKLNINHLKMIQDLNGILITLVRVCRLDNGTDGLFESFRKDLQQVVIPLYVDPVTYQSEINTSIRVPADAFPTISDCPLVSFQYFVEVLINLSGKSIVLENKSYSNLNNLPDSLNVDFKIPGDFKFNFNSSSNNYQAERSGFINTDKFKRMKKFVQMTNEVIIGTFRLEPEPSRSLHSENNNMSNNSISQSSSPVVFNLADPSAECPSTHMYTPSASNISESNDATPPYLMSSPSEIGESPIPDYDDIRNDYHNQNILSNTISEKDQVRTFERTLLPSEPQLNDIDEEQTSELIDPPRDCQLENISEQDEPRQNISNDLPQKETLQYQFFSEHNSIATLTQEDGQNQEGLDSGSITNENGNIVHEDLDDQYSEIDYVPNYDSFKEDRLVINETNESTTNSETRNS